VLIPNHVAIKRYSDIYFPRSVEVIRNLSSGIDINTQVQYRTFFRKPGMISGMDRVLAGLERAGATRVKYLQEGRIFEAKEIVLLFEGKAVDLIPWETWILSTLTMCKTALNMHDIWIAAHGAPVYDASARHYPPELWPYIVRAASIGGASGTSTMEGAVYAFDGMDKNPVGTIPHALNTLVSVASEREYRVAELASVDSAYMFNKTHPRTPFVVLLDYEGKELQATRQACDAFKDNPMWWGVRLDTAGERYCEGCVPIPMGKEKVLVTEMDKWEHGRGVSMEAYHAVQGTLARDRCGHKGIMLSSGFNAEKTAAFYGHKALDPKKDAVLTGSYIELCGGTSDVVKVKKAGDANWTNSAKAGRQWVLNADTRRLTSGFPFVGSP